MNHLLFNSGSQSFWRRLFVSRQALESRMVNVDTDCVFIHQLASKKTGNGDYTSGNKGEVHTPGPDNGRRIIDPQQPIQRGKRQQHDGQNAVTPGCDQPSYSGYNDQVNQTNGAGHPTAQSTYADEPEAGTSPEKITCPQIGQICCNKPEQGSDWKMDQNGVNRVTFNGHPAGYGLQGHNASFGLTRVIRVLRSLNSSLAGVGAVVISLLLTACSGPYSTLDPAGPAARDIAGLWWAMFAFSTLVLIGVTALWIYAIRRPSSHPDEKSAQAFQNRWIIWGGLALPLGTIALLLAFGIPIGHRMMPLPAESGEVLQIEVTGHQWWWAVHYPDQAIDLRDEIHIPVGTPIDLVLRSNDVIHSFWVPRLGGKMDMIPGHTNVLRLQADEPGVYRGSCTEFCGLGHAHMQFTVTAHTEDDFDHWQQQAQESTE